MTRPAGAAAGPGPAAGGTHHDRDWHWQASSAGMLVPVTIIHRDHLRFVPSVTVTVQVPAAVMIIMPPVMMGPGAAGAGARPAAGPGAPPGPAA